MAHLNETSIQAVIAEIRSSHEKDRRALASRRHSIYKDGGKGYLIEQLEREFGEDTLKEMRLIPLNILKKIVNKRSVIYKNGAIRTTELESDQALVDFYVKALEMNQKMLKANRYFNLFSNTALYVWPTDGDFIKFEVVPPYLYSINTDPMNQTKVRTWIFNAFVDEANIIQHDDIEPATGRQSYDRDRGQAFKGEKINSGERVTQTQYVFWTDNAHFTTDDNGNVLILDPELGNEQFDNPILISPVVNLTKERDAEAWATQGEDLVDLTVTIQQALTDTFTIAKHQGFSVLTIVSEEEPSKLQIGTNKAIWLKSRPDGVQPSISYVQANSPLSEYNEMIKDLIGLALSTNDMNPGVVSAQMSGQSATSGFDRMLQMVDTNEAVQTDTPAVRKAEEDVWELIKRWHNFMFDSKTLRADAASLGKFSDDFQISIVYPENRPIESERERIDVVRDLMAMGLLTRMEAVKKLNPDLTDEQIEAKLADITEERASNVVRLLGNPQDENTSDGEKDTIPV